MKNITVSVDDTVYHRARVRAAERKTSVSALVREHLVALAGEETERERLERLEAETWKRVEERGARYAAGKRMPREAAHNRNALR